MQHKKTLVLFLCGLVVGASCDPALRAAPTTTAVAPEPGEVDPVPLPASGAARTRSVYVPAYSHAPASEGQQDRMLSILLSVRNIDVSTPVTVKHVDYFDTSGHRVRRYLSKPRVLQPLETAEFEVAKKDNLGGSGANFLVYWEGPSDAHALLTEAVMFYRDGTGHFAFSTRGIELNERPVFPESVDKAKAP